MRRMRRALVTLMLLTAMVTLAAGPATADHTLPTGADEWYDDGWDDPWSDEGWSDDPCLDPTLSDAEFEACLGDIDDPWGGDDWGDGPWSDDPCLDPTLSDAEFEACLGDMGDPWGDAPWGDDPSGDDPWDDEPWDDEPWDQGGFGIGPWDAPEVDPAAAEDAVASMEEAIDACFEAADDLGWCLLDAIDILFGELFPFDEELDQPWPGEGGFGDEPWFDDGLDPVDDPDAEREIVARFEQLIPEEWRSRIVSIELETDGPEGIVAAVEPTTGNLSEWTLYVDPADAGYELDTTLIHEFAHVMTLNETQLDAQFVWSDREYEEAAESCPTYFTGEGCALSGSYIAEFVDLFWDPIMGEFEAIEDARSQWEWEEAMRDFYDRYADHFVSDYAATNPAEDISESFTAFVLAPELPDGDTVAEQKVLFFARFDELVELREAIRAALQESDE